MSLTPSTLFSTPSATQAGTWKPVSTAAAGGGKSLVATAFSAPPTQSADSVDVSPLAKALTGVAAKVFEKLDSKARGMLEGYVKTGMMTADEVVGGLRTIGKEAVQSRYMNNLWEEDGGLSGPTSHVNKDNYNKHMDFMDGAKNLMKNLEDIASGDRNPSASQLKDSMRDLEDYRDNFIKENGDFAEQEHDQDQSYIAKSSRDLKNSTLFSDEGDGEFFSKSDRESLSKLIDLGFDSRVYASAAKAAVSDVDLNGVQKISSSNNIATAANAAPSTKTKQASSQLSTSQTEAQKDTLAIPTLKTPENDAMLALLKANAENTPDRQGTPNIQKASSALGTNGNEAVLMALTQSLKNNESNGHEAGAGRTDTIV